MRPPALIPLLALALALTFASPARAIPAGFEFVMPTAPLPAGQPFTFDVRRVGDWDIDALDEASRRNPDGFISVPVLLGSNPLGSVLLSFFAVDANRWFFPAAWRFDVPALTAGTYTLSTAYAGDDVNPAVAEQLNFTIAPSNVIIPKPRVPPLFRPIGILPFDVGPTGQATITNILTLEVELVDISSLVFINPITGKSEIDSARLPANALVTYFGDSNYAPFNYTYNTPEPIPAPAAPFALALLALAALRRRTRPATLPPILRGSPCRTPTSSTCASTPPIR